METIGGDEVAALSAVDPFSRSAPREGAPRDAFDRLIAAMPNAVYYKADDGAYLSCNPSFARLIGRAEDEILGRTDFDLFPPRTAARLFRMDSELLKGKGRHVAEIRLPGADGSDLFLLSDRAVLRDDAGRPSGIVGTLSDVTDARRDERERSAALVMAAAAEMAIQTIEGMIDPVIILNAGGRVERINRGYAELFGLARPVIGKDLTAVFLDQTPASVRALLKRCGAQGRIRDVEARVADAEGAVRPVLANISILRDSQRAVDGFVVAIRDVSSLVEATTKLRENERTLDALLDASEDAVFLIDAAGTVKAANRAFARRCGHTEESIVGLAVADLPEADAFGPASEFVSGIVASGRPSRAERERGDKVFFNSGFPIFGSDGAVRDVAVFSYDITERKQAERLQRALYSISEAAYFAHDMRNLFRIVHRIVARLVPAQDFFIALIDPASGRLECPYAVFPEGEAGDAAARAAVLADGLVDYLLAAGKALLLGPDDVVEVLRIMGREPSGNLPREWLGVPLKNGEGRAIGALVARRRGGPEGDGETAGFGEAGRKIFNFVSSQVAMAIERKRNEEELRAKNARLKSLTEGTILALVKAVEIRDPYTAGHQQRVARLAEAIARDLGLGDESAEATRMAALLHDVGKISIPLELLSKPGKLSELEFHLIRQHPVVSYDILRSIDFAQPVAQFALEHHEKVDGSGYPAGLRGEAIHLESRIICVADVVDAMVSHRPYRPSLGLATALAEIEAQAGKLYDADVARSCLDLFRSGRFAFEAEASSSSSIR